MCLEQREVIHRTHSEPISKAKFLLATTYLHVDNDNNVNSNPNLREFRLLLGHEVDLMRAPYCLMPPLRLYFDDFDHTNQDPVVERASVTVVEAKKGSYKYLALFDLTNRWRREDCS